MTEHHHQSSWALRVRGVVVVVAAILFVYVSIAHSTRTSHSSSPEPYFTDASESGLQIVPASGGSGPLPTCGLWLTPSTVNQPSAATLAWSSAYASTFYITNISYVTPNNDGSTSVAPSVTTTYTGTVTNENGTGTCGATLAVNRSCSFNSGTITHGNATTSYQSATVPYGSSCVSETRTCNDGTLSGTYTYGSCAPLTGPDFSISITDLAMNASQLAAAAQPATIRKRVDATLLSGAAATVSFSISGLPASGVTYSFSPASCTMSCSSTLTVNVGSDAPTGNYTVTVTGTGPGPTVRSNTFTLNVACQAAYSCSGNDVQYTNSSCVTSTVTSCVAPSFCSAGSSVCLTNPPVYNSSGSFTGHLQMTPNLVASGSTTQVHWDISNVNANSCSVTGSNGDSWLHLASSGVGGKTSSPITQQTTYTLQCTADDGTPINETQTVLVAPKFQEQ